MWDVLCGNEGFKAWWCLLLTAAGTTSCLLPREELERACRGEGGGAGRPLQAISIPNAQNGLSSVAPGTRTLLNTSRAEPAVAVEIVLFCLGTPSANETVGWDLCASKQSLKGQCKPEPFVSAMLCMERGRIQT